MSSQDKTPEDGANSSTSEQVEVTEHPILNLISAALSAQTPLAAAHVSRLRSRRPNSTPKQLLKVLDRQFLAATTGSGAAVGTAAAAPGVGTAIGAAMALGETAVSLQARFFTFLLAPRFTKSRSLKWSGRTLIFTVLLGASAEKIVHNVAGRTGRHWAKHTLNAIPMSAIRSINKAIGVNFVTKYGTKQGLIVLGKVVPFGFGAVIGGGLNFVIGQTVVKATQRAFGEPDLDPRVTSTETA
jgi:hypothetical protein